MCERRETPKSSKRVVGVDVSDSTEQFHILSHLQFVHLGTETALLLLKE